MITEQNKNKIIEITKKHFDTIDIINVDGLIQEKAQRMFNMFPDIYRELEKEKVLPEKITYDVFSKVLTARLEAAAQQAFFSNQMGGFF